MATEVGGAFVGVGEPTAQGSDEIDYGLVAKCLVPILQVKTDWETPFRPHAAMHWMAQPCSSPDVPDEEGGSIGDGDCGRRTRQEGGLFGTGSNNGSNKADIMAMRIRWRVWSNADSASIARVMRRTRRICS